VLRSLFARMLPCALCGHALAHDLCRFGLVNRDGVNYFWACPYKWLATAKQPSVCNMAYARFDASKDPVLSYTGGQIPYVQNSRASDGRHA
jgi:hypothetical protein